MAKEIKLAGGLTELRAIADQDLVHLIIKPNRGDSSMLTSLNRKDQAKLIEFLKSQLAH